MPSFTVRTAPSELIFMIKSHLLARQSKIRLKSRSSQEPIQQAQPFSEATAPQPEVEVSEANEAGPENMESPGEESGEETATEDTSADLEPIEHENSPEEESNQPEETESDLDIPENSQ